MNVKKRTFIPKQTEVNIRVQWSLNEHWDSYYSAWQYTVGAVRHYITPWDLWGPKPDILILYVTTQMEATLISEPSKYLNVLQSSDNGQLKLGL